MNAADYCADVTYARCTPKEYEVMLRFLDKCFEKPEKRWFDKYYGHIFQRRPPYAGRTFLFRKGTRIAGAIGVYPLSLRIGRAVLSVGGIGSVSVDPAVRGRGVMSCMLRSMIDEMERGGYDISWLGGDRFRYRNYGWDIGGRRIVFNVRLRDIERYYPRLPQCTVSSGLARDYRTLVRIYNRFETAVVRDMQSWRNLSRRRGYGRMAAESGRGNAYLIYLKENARWVVEIQGDPLTATALLARYMRSRKLNHVDVTYPYTHDGLAQMLHHSAANFTVQNNSQIRVINTDTTWKKLMPEVRRRLAADTKAEAIADLEKTENHDDRNLIIERLLGFFDTLPVFPGRMKKFEFLRPLGWWMSEYDSV